MKTEILKLLENDAKLTPEQISVMLDIPLDEVKACINEFENNSTILGYKAVVDWEKTERESVTAMIDVKLTPQRGKGYDRVAEKIYGNFCG
jgi:DNA-binding Lrp family transcriptional regulator